MGISAANWRGGTPQGPPTAWAYWDGKFADDALISSSGSNCLSAPYQISFGWNYSTIDTAAADHQPGPWFYNNSPASNNFGYVIYSMNMGNNLESNHGGGAVVTFCDSHTIFLNSSISSTVYEQLCNPNDMGIPYNSSNSNNYYSGDSSGHPGCAYPPLDESNYSQ